MVLVELLCVTLFVALLAGVNWYVYEYVQNMEPSGRCSSTYPDHGVILDNAVTLVDGSLQTEDGTVYPPGAFWVEDGVVRGCPCSIGPCVYSCCTPDKYIVDDDHCEFVPRSDPVYKGTDVLEVFSRNDPLQKVNVSRDHYSVVRFSRGVDLSYYADKKAKDFILLDDGRIWDTKRSSYYILDRFCFNARDNVLIDRTPFYMFYDALVEVKWYLVFKYALTIIPTVLLAVTFVVFLLVVRLRSGCGKAIMNYVAAQFFHRFLMLCSVNKGDIDYFVDVSAHIWQLVIAFQLRSAFRPGRPCSQDHTSRRKTILYSALFWGIALVWTVIIHYNMSLRDVKYLSRNHVGFLLLIRLIKTMALVLAEIACLVLSVSAMCGIRAGKINSERLQEANNSQRHNNADIQWSSLFLKISLLTGIDYIFLNAFEMYKRIDLWMAYEFGIDSNVYIPWFIILTLTQINNLRGVEIFFIFVFKMEVLKSIAEKLRLRKKKPNANIPMQNLQQRPGPSRPVRP